MAGPSADRPWRRAAQPYSIYDYSGSVGSLYFGTSDYIGNPIVPLKPGVTVGTGGTAGHHRRECRQACPGRKCFRAAVRRAGDQRRAALRASRLRSIRIALRKHRAQHLPRSVPGALRYEPGQGICSERALPLRFNFDAFNVFNHPDFDAPNNNVTFFPDYLGAAVVSADRQPGNHPAHHRKLAIPAALDAPDVLKNSRKTERGASSAAMLSWPAAHPRSPAHD